MTLAIFGGEPAIRTPLANFNTIGAEEIEAVAKCMREVPLSSFLGGHERGGLYVQRLEDMWATKLGVRHAIACNSATSGLMAAAFAVGLKDGDKFITTPFTMSATVAAPMFTGATPLFSDVTDDDFNLDPFNMASSWNAKAIFTTNLFGHPSKTKHLRFIADQFHQPIIEDNSQSPFAMEDGHYTGTIGDIGIFSLNIHKHLQCGEGGVVVTNNDDMALAVRRFINHGEMAGGPIGLNLRLTEYAAAIAMVQLKKASEIISGRRLQAQSLSTIAAKVDWLRPPIEREGCKHVYYTWSFLLDEFKLKVHRDVFVKAMEAEGFPLVSGYVKPLYHLPAFTKYSRPCYVAEDLHSTRLGYFENCGYTLTDDQFDQFGEALTKIEANVGKLRSAT